ncbi:conserved hypothetical protein [Synechococcus elongatus PCC 7942 = FACHB-805]|nr:conserved hypothetical protein [Synechococcus elongatus PCC 7942 = FACHB-805]BAD78203.1 hypothetical protein syc0013_d [Synechococcus elongatus PCC 6301]
MPFGRCLAKRAIAAHNCSSSCASVPNVTSVPTVSDSKRAFYAAYPRPINPLYRRVVEELLVEIHLLSVNTSFVYDPLFALGVVTAFDSFMSSYRPIEAVGPLFTALTQAVRQNPEQYRHDANAIAEQVRGVGSDTIRQWLTEAEALGNAPELVRSSFQAIAGRSEFKYSRLFAIGLFSLLETAAPDLVQDPEALKTTVTAIAERFHLPSDKLQKDLDLYRSNLEKMEQARITMEEAIQADRRKREQREQEKLAKAAAAEAPAALEASSDNPEPETSETPS